MAKIFIVLALGFVVGFCGILKEKGLKINAKLQTVWLMPHILYGRQHRQEW